MSEAEAQRIFDLKLSLCRVLGGDLRAECIAAGVPEVLVDKLIAADKRLTTFFNGHDDLGQPRK